MEVGIKVIAEDILKKVVRHANSCFFTMVAVDEQRKPVAVPQLELILPEQQRRNLAAIARKQIRKEFAERYDGVRQA
jgi:acyl-CoA hydrolase